MNASSLKPQIDHRSDACIWQQAGVVRHKRCLAGYDCTACRFDRAMRRAAQENLERRRTEKIAQGRRAAIVFWKEKLNELPAWKRPCVHHMKGRIEFRACTNEYQCGNCEFDQYFSDQFTVHAVVRPVDFCDIKGIKLPQGYYLHEGHCWAKLEADSTVRIGLDDFASRVMGPLDAIDAPLMGKTLAQGRADIALRRGPHAANLLSPVSGVVLDVNPQVRESAGLANRDPYTEGWVMRLHATDLRRDLKRLMIGEQAGEFLDGEVDRLFEVIAETAGPLAADGGQLGSDLFGSLPEIGWDKLTRLFLRNAS